MDAAGRRQPSCPHAPARPQDPRHDFAYVQVTQNDLQQQYHLARQNMVSVHSMPQIPTTYPLNGMPPGIPAITQYLTDIRHLLDMYRTNLANPRYVAGDSWSNRLAKIPSVVNELYSTI